MLFGYGFFNPSGGGGSGTISGSGTINNYAKFVGATEIGDALLTDDGTNLILPSGNFSIAGQLYQATLTSISPSGTTQTINWNNGNVQAINLEDASGDVTLTLTNPQITCYTLKIIQDGATPRNIFWPGTVLWAGGVAPTISTGANAIDTVTLIWDGTNYLGVYSQTYAV